ncbi:MAG: phosphate starvation-inducible protein PhoH [Verrucomicrobia bacterium]|nr:MAG: phosphate starvation-inducible protein PhoH [Verrucomicrobiota bacterium]
MTTETLHFDNPRLAQLVLGNDPANLAVLEQQLGVRAVARDAWIKLEGEEEAVSRAREFLRSMERTVRAGGTLRSNDFQIALGVVREEGAPALASLESERIQTSPRKASVAPKTVGQRRYLEAIRTHTLTIAVGPAGTGKTYLAVAAATAAFKAGEVDRIILTRPAVEAGEALGFLPGDLKEKLSPYLRPLYDALRDMLPAQELQRHMATDSIEIAPLAYMRGRTLNNSFIIFDEAQNATAEQMFMFLTRLGFNSRAVVTGDLTQIDLPRRKTSGLFEARAALREVEDVAIVELGQRDVVRHPLVQRILQAYERHRGTSE